MRFGPSEPKAATGSICVSEGKTEMPQRFQDLKGPWIIDTLPSEKGKSVFRVSTKHCSFHDGIASVQSG